MTVNPVGPNASPVVTTQYDPVPRNPAADGAVSVAAAKSTTAPAPAVAASVASTAPSQEEVKQAARQVEQVVQTKASNLRFSLDKDTGKTIVKVIDSRTDEVIRQIPSEEMLELAKSLDEMQLANGALLNSKV